MLLLAIALLALAALAVAAMRARRRPAPADLAPDADFEPDLPPARPPLPRAPRAIHHSAPRHGVPPRGPRR
jgi:hypothetical protein